MPSRVPQQASPRPGMLLVATPALLDPNFAGSVVLLIEADDSGALGVILNRPSMLPVGGVLESWAGQVSDPEVLFKGGPVGADGALAVGRLADPAAEPVGFKGVSPGWGLVDLDTPVDLVAGAFSGLRIFVGYAGWDAQQLRDEVSEGSWYVVPSEAPDVFGPDTATLLRDVLRRQPGPLAWWSTRPLNPDHN
ncbi:MAG: YqgE/AlgH family protein [Nocardioides sp.]